jgi:hypothetical protein
MFVTKSRSDLSGPTKLFERPGSDFPTSISLKNQENAGYLACFQ